MPSDAAPTAHAAGSFVTTRWSLVLRAGAEGTRESLRALDELCRIYWYPLYCYVRRRGHSPADTEDLVQGFFAQLLERELFAQADQAKGRLRGFLLSGLQFYLANQHRREHTAKRGGGAPVVSFDALDAESRYAAEPVDALSPDVLFARRWALIILQRVEATLAADWQRADKTELYAALAPHLFVPLENIAATTLGARFGMQGGAVKTALHRLREQYRHALRTEIAETVDSESEIEDELAALHAALGSG